MPNKTPLMFTSTIVSQSSTGEIVEWPYRHHTSIAEQNVKPTIRLLGKRDETFQVLPLSHIRHSVYGLTPNGSDLFC